MQTDNRILDDLARVATSAIGTLQTVRDDVRTLVRQQVERLLDDMDLVSRDEFEVVKAMAAAARSENEALAKRVAKIEVQLGKPAARRKAAAPKPAAKRGTKRTQTSRPKRTAR